MSRNALSLALLALAAVAVLDVTRVLPAGWSLPATGAFSFASPAFADDDGGGDDGGGDDGGGDDGAGDDGGSGARDGTGEGMKRDRNRAGGKTRRAAPAAVAPQLPVRASGEIVVSGLSDADLATLVAEGFAVIEALSITRNGPVLHRLQRPAGVSMEAARDSVRKRETGTNADFNHYFRTSEVIVPAAAPEVSPTTKAAPCDHLNCAVLNQIAWPLSRPPTCQATIEIGVIDTSLNLDHAGLADAQIDLIRLADEDLPVSGETHGTAVVALLVGDEPRAPGLLPEARLVAVDIFSREGGDERADVVHLVQALDLLAERKVRVVNLSLAGPENSVLSDMLAAVEQAGVLVVAAAGNGGPASPPAWPAAAGTVLAVTAVDGNDRIYRRAQRGVHVDVAAPGVEIWSAASTKGVKPRTGTSYATPFVTAAAAILISGNPLMTPAATIAHLRGLTRDLGAKGADEVFGSGVLMLSSLCGPTAP